jgi:hypothetical protein
MQVAAHQVIHVVSMGHRLVAASRTVPVPGLVAATGVIGRTRVRIRFADAEPVLFHPLATLVVEMTVVEIVGMSLVRDRGVATPRSVAVRVLAMRLVSFGSHLATPCCA